MDNTKEKLIELLDEVQHQGNSTETGVNYVFNGAVADHLITNGVTIQKHGKWEMISHSEVDQCADYACSVCSGVLIDVIDDPEHELNAYCPMCGAKMDGERREGE